MGSADPVLAEELWRALSRADAPSSARAALEAVARAWGLSLGPFDVGPIDAAENLVIAGPSAIAAAIEAFSEGTALDWTDQVLVVATPPAHRQLAALAGALLHATKPSRIVTAELANTAALPRGARVLVSEDAATVDVTSATQRVAGEDGVARG